ncbi:MAG: hypothetical protein NTV69_16680, partial [Caldilinea sp.]|nr:hypothetical protein [Caldilinea sp.]
MAKIALLHGPNLNL